MRLGKLQAAYEEEVNRRKAAGEDEISFEAGDFQALEGPELAFLDGIG